MFSSIPKFREELKDRIVEVVPSKWKVEKDLTAPTNTLVPSVYLEFTAIENTFAGKLLPPGQVSALADLIIMDPRTSEQGEQEIEKHLVYVIGMLDQCDDILWTGAEKQRLEATGEFLWRVHTQSILSLTEGDTP